MARASTAADVKSVPRNFSLYYGFGQPLDVLDDMELLQAMAQLKQAAREPQFLAPPSSAPDWEAAPATPSLEHRPQRPRTAPSAGRPPAPRPTGSIADNLATRQQAVREQLQVIREKHKREAAASAAKLEQRWHEADRVVEQRRQSMYRDAQQQVGKWAERRAQGRSRMITLSERRTHSLNDDLRIKEERTEAWRQEQEIAAKEAAKKRLALRAESAKRFGQVLQARESRLEEAQRRAAARQSTNAEMKRAELLRRAEESTQRELKALEARASMQKALQAKIARTEEDISRKAVQGDKIRTSKVGMGASAAAQASTAKAASRPSDSPRRRALKAHHGHTGLESSLLRCTLCEQQFTSLSGVTYLKAVGVQRAAFGDDSLLQWCEKRGLLKMYESASLCVFCCQFFQGRWQDKE